MQIKFELNLNDRQVAVITVRADTNNRQIIVRLAANVRQMTDKSLYKMYAKSLPKMESFKRHICPRKVTCLKRRYRDVGLRRGESVEVV